MTRRFLADASSLIAVASAGHLEVLRQVVSRVHVTTVVLEEVVGERPGGAAIQRAVEDGWIQVVNSGGSIAGLGPGEASTIANATRDDVVILDDAVARKEAQSRALRVTGLLGLIVHGAQTKKLTREKATQILDDLARGNFRMSAELYRWAIAALHKVE